MSARPNARPRWWRRRSSRLVVVAAGVVVILVAGVAIAGSLWWGDDDVTFSASSSALGTSPAALADGPDPGSPTDAPRETAWRTAGETRGAWVRTEWATPRTIDAITVVGTGVDADRMTGATVRFSDGSSILVTTDANGDASVAIPERSVSWALLTVAGSAPGQQSVALAGLAIDGSGTAVSDAAATASPSVSSSEGDTDAGALGDATDSGSGRGREWTAASDDEAPSARLTWDTPVELAAVQLFGPTAPGRDSPGGTLVFDDGSVVLVSGVASGDVPASTIAFMPRMTRWVEFRLDEGLTGLSEFVGYIRGETPPAWTGPIVDGISLPDAPVQDCGSVERRPPNDGGPTLLCPTPGSSSDGSISIVVVDRPQTELLVTGWQPLGTDVDLGREFELTRGTTGDDGMVTFDVSTARLARGPVTLKVVRTAAFDAASPLYVQLVNEVGTASGRSDYAPEGMTLQWDEEFVDPISITQDGAGALYTATKPTARGPSEFGEAVFADPAWGEQTIGVLDDDFLRIRSQPLEGRADPGGYDRTAVSGMVSSMRIGGSGFGAQYGYFEARILGAPGRGSWPAFWTLNSGSTVSTDGLIGEVDAIELYGHDTLGGCTAVHKWVDGNDDAKSECIDDTGADWAMAWHTYGVQVTPDGAEFFIDGESVTTLRGLQLEEEPFYFLVNLALDGGWPVDLGQTGDVTDLYVDYIRVYT